MLNDTPGERLAADIAEIKTMLKQAVARLERGEERFIKIESRMVELEKSDVRVATIAAVAAFVVPLLIRFFVP